MKKLNCRIWSMDDNETIWTKIIKLKNINITNIKNSWLLLDPEHYLKKKLKMNPIHPFKKSSVNGIYVFTSCIFWDTFRNISLLIGLLFFMIIRMSFQISKGLDDYITISILCSFFLIIRLIWCMNGRTLIIDHNCRCYEYYRGEKIIYRGHLHNVFVRLKSTEAAEGEIYFKVILGGYLVDEFDVTNYSDKSDGLKILAKQLAKNLNINYIDHKDISRHHVVRHLCPYFIESIHRPSLADNSDYDYITFDDSIHKSEYKLTSFSSTSIKSDRKANNFVENENLNKREGSINDEDLSITELLDKDLYALEMYEFLDTEIEDEIKDEKIHSLITSDCVMSNQLSSDTLTYTYSYCKNHQLTNLQSISTKSLDNLTTSTNLSIFKVDNLLDYSFSEPIEYISSESSPSLINCRLDSLSEISSILTDISVPSLYLPRNEYQLKQIKIQKNDIDFQLNENKQEKEIVELEMETKMKPIGKDYETEKINNQFGMTTEETDTFSSGQTLDSLTHTLITTYTYTYDPSIGDIEYKDCV